jgi:hypothetical protein
VRFIKSQALSSDSPDKSPLMVMLSVITNLKRVRCTFKEHQLPACPSSFHEFEGPDPIPYDDEGDHSTDYFVTGLPPSVK